MSPLIQRGFLSPDQIEEEAAELRREVGLESIPVDPFVIADSLGISVFLGTFKDDSIEGVFRTRKARPEILIRKASPLTRQKFTVAHELGHFRLHWDAVEGDGEHFIDADRLLYRKSQIPGQPTDKGDRDREIQANMYASALLMPREQVVLYAQSIQGVRDLAKTFGVSEVAMRYRIGDLDVW